MTDFAYDSGVAREAEAALAGTIASTEANLADLNGFVNAVAANWTGEEQATYRGVQAQWDQAAATVQQILQSIKANLGANTDAVDVMQPTIQRVLQRH